MTSEHRREPCPDCGRDVVVAWLGRHQESGCRVGVRASGGRLSPRQVEVVRHLPLGSTAAIAGRLDITIATIKQHIWESSQRLGVYASRTALLMEALRRGEVTLEELVGPAHVLNREEGS